MWNGSITQLEVKKLERVQRIAVKLIYGNMEGYSKILDKLKMEKLVDRRQRLCLNFAKKQSNTASLTHGSNRKRTPIVVECYTVKLNLEV